MGVNSESIWESIVSQYGILQQSPTLMNRNLSEIVQNFGRSVSVL